MTNSYLVTNGLELWDCEGEELHEAVAVNDVAGLPVVATPHPRLLQHLHGPTIKSSSAHGVALRPEALFLYSPLFYSTVLPC